MKIFDTARLSMSEAELNDAPFIHTLVNDSEWLRFLDNKGISTLKDAEHYILNKLHHDYQNFGFGLFIVRLKESMTPIGLCGLLKRDYLEFADIGFGFLSDYCGKGYAQESARGVMVYGKNRLGLEKIIAIVNVKNHKSINLLQKIGLDFSQIIRNPENGSLLHVYA